MRAMIDNPVQRYAWGSVEAIPRLVGVEPDGLPQAELWLGAHERAASLLAGPAGEESLLDVVRREPDAALGAPWATERRMPFLAKVIATAAPLSLQVHPDAERASRWFSEEEALGIRHDSTERSCPDAVAKIEMVRAISEFRALCGFRPIDEMMAWLDALDVAALKPTVEALRRHGSAALGSEVSRLLRSTGAADVVPGVGARAGVLVHDPHWAESARIAGDLAARYPADPAVPLALLLRPHVLAPGEAMVVRPGQPHSYLSGTAFEVQANSDNVLRAGLTTKHVDVDRLLEALDTTATGTASVAGARRGDELVFAPETGRFALAVIGSSVPAGLPDVPGPQVFFCLDGLFDLHAGADHVRLERGRAAFVPAAQETPSVQGSGTLLRVTTGRTPSDDGHAGPWRPRAGGRGEETAG